jgi:hypothetical protein
MGVKPGFSHRGRNMGWGCESIGYWGRYFGIRIEPRLRHQPVRSFVTTVSTRLSRLPKLRYYQNFVPTLSWCYSVTKYSCTYSRIYEFSDSALQHIGVLQLASTHLPFLRLVSLFLTPVIIMKSQVGSGKLWILPVILQYTATSE